MLGILFSYLLLRDPSSVSDFWKFGVIVAVILFVHGYYVTTALVGVVWPTRRWWLYLAIAAALLIIHTRLIFLHGGADLTPEARAIELPFALVGAASCSPAASQVVAFWRDG
ncbi:MAG TPA: hypothetical protein VN682_20285 [Terriglobales bacterium]|nr:hypothetical protein [Terriglobales bacterium]